MANYYLTIARQRWGRGETLSESFKNARLEPGDEFQFYIIMAEAPHYVFVDDMGGVSYPPNGVIFKSDIQTFVDPAEWLD